MHLIISHAAGAGVQCQAAIAQLALPNLEKLLRLSNTTRTLHGAPESLTPLPERVQANSMGLHGQDGLLPWAAAEARERGLTSVHGAAGWAWITPCHWRAHTQHVEMLGLGPAELDLRSDESEALRTSMAGYFAEDGIALHPGTHNHWHRWLAFGTIFHDLPTASLQRVANATINPWLPRQPQAKGLRRLQSEMQMLLYTHPVNDAREARGVPSVNAFWVSGTGTLARPIPRGSIRTNHRGDPAPQRLVRRCAVLGRQLANAGPDAAGRCAGACIGGRPTSNHAMWRKQGGDAGCAKENLVAAIASAFPCRVTSTPTFALPVADPCRLRFLAINIHA
ncbi:MAG: hypothetical protein IPH35_07310 [Rhodoferax sp.]|nr:hypothetical protein [Rhodoferax sp.]